MKIVVSQGFSFYFKYGKEEVSGRFDLFPLSLPVGGVLCWGEPHLKSQIQSLGGWSDQPNKPNCEDWLRS